MKKSICIIITALLLLLAVSCSSDTGREAQSSEQNSALSVSAEKPSEAGNSPVPVTLEDFKKTVRSGNLGTVNEVGGDQGYEAALVTGEDRTNYIYMNLPDEDMAYSVLTDSDGDGKKDSDLSLDFQSDEYELYTMETAAPESSPSDSAMYGKCIRAGRVIIIVNGPLENRSVIHKNAGRFLQELGYDTEKD